MTDAVYASFYRSLSNDWEDHLSVKHSSLEGQLDFRALPSTWSSPRKKGTTSSCTSTHSRVNFAKGVVDSKDLPLNILWEILQQNKILRVVKKNLVKKVPRNVCRNAEKKDDYQKFYKKCGKCLELGINEDSTNRTKIAELFKCKTSKSGDEQISLKEYVDRMKEGQNVIDYITVGSIAVVSSSYREEGS